MKIGILADIHGNERALREVLRQLRTADVQHLFVLGDLIGYYYQAREVLESLQGWPLTVVRGNHERILAQAMKDANVEQMYTKKYGSSLNVALKTLSSDQISWLASLPDSTTTAIDGVVFELCHGSPRDADEYVYPDASVDVVEKCCLPDRDFVLMGHTHYPMIVANRGTCLLNPGSVGQSRDMGGFASWCLLDTRTGVVQFRRTPYDVHGLIAEVMSIDPHIPALVAVLTRNSQFNPQRD